MECTGCSQRRVIIRTKLRQQLLTVVAKQQLANNTAFLQTWSRFSVAMRRSRCWAGGRNIRCVWSEHPVARLTHSLAHRHTHLHIDTLTCTPNMSSQWWRLIRAHSEVWPCSRLVARAISPHVTSAPRPLHTTRNGRLPHWRRNKTVHFK